MKDVYPAIESQKDDLHDVVKEVEAEILKDPREKMKLDEFLDTKMSRRKALLAISALTISLIILSACNIMAGTPSVKVTQTDSPIVETTEVGATEEATSTVEATEAAEPALIVWESVELEIAGRPVEFVIGKEEGVDLWAKWGIEGLKINENLNNYKEKFTTFISASLWQIYQSQTMSEVSYEEFMQNPENCKIRLVTPDGEGGFQGEAFTMDQINRFEIRYINREDPRLYYENKLLSTTNYGYKIREDGTLVMYSTYQESDNNLDGVFSQKYFPYWGESLPQVTGLFVGDGIICGFLGMAYSVNLGSPEPMPDYRKDYLDRSGKIQEMCDYPTAAKIESSPGNTWTEQIVGYIPNHGFFEIIFK